MLVKPLGVKTQNMKILPLEPFSHDASHILNYTNIYGTILIDFIFVFTS